MPAETSIYWNSVDSQRSTSGGSSGSSGSASRHYVDPWDLENYAYLRRHSVAGLTQQAPRSSHRRLSHEARAQSEYWCSPVREPGYDAPAVLEELYCGPPKQTNNGCYYHQPIYEDDVPDYVAPLPVYAPLSELRHGDVEVQRRVRHRCKPSSGREYQRTEYVDPRILNTDMRETDVLPESEYHSSMASPMQERYEAPRHLDLNTYGHLRMDYTNSWNSLNRKINK